MLKNLRYRQCPGATQTEKARYLSEFNKFMSLTHIRYFPDQG